MFRTSVHSRGYPTFYHGEDTLVGSQWHPDSCMHNRTVLVAEGSKVQRWRGVPSASVAISSQQAVVEFPGSCFDGSTVKLVVQSGRDSKCAETAFSNHGCCRHMRQVACPPVGSRQRSAALALSELLLFQPPAGEGTGVPLSAEPPRCSGHSNAESEFRARARVRNSLIVNSSEARRQRNSGHGVTTQARNRSPTTTLSDSAMRVEPQLTETCRALTRRRGCLIKTLLRENHHASPLASFLGFARIVFHTPCSRARR